MRVIVVGAGVVGLTCAVRLAEAGLDVDVLARDLPPETTSATAGGLWLPYRVGPIEDVMRWARTTFATLAELAGDDRAGVRLMPGTLLHRSPVGPPAPGWAATMADLARVEPVTDPAPGYGSGWAATLPMVHTPTHLQWLTGRLRAAGGTLTRLGLVALPRQGVIINCTGLAARALAADPSTAPTRGQVVVLRDPGLTHWYVDEDDLRAPTYVLPRGVDVVVGGTAENGDWSTIPDPATGAQLLDRAVALVPALRRAEVVAHRVGLRPGRPSVRLELVSDTGQDGRDHHLVHCYGHGGSGWTLAAGCADDVLALLRSLP